MAKAIKTPPEFRLRMSDAIDALVEADKLTIKGIMHCVNKEEAQKLIDLLGNEPDFEDVIRIREAQDSVDAKKRIKLEKLASELGAEVTYA